MNISGIYVSYAGSGTANVVGNIIADSYRAGISMASCNATFTDNVVESPETKGFWVLSGSTGSGLFQGNIVDDLNAGQAAFQNDSPSTFPVTLSGNVGF